MNAIVKVTAAILVHDGKILIAQRKLTDRLALKWEFPGGKIEENEMPEDCLKREMMEEFGIEVAIGDYIGSSLYHYDHISIELMAFRTYWISGEIELRDHEAFEWVAVDELHQYDFAPADLPFVEKLCSNEIPLREIR